MQTVLGLTGLAGCGKSTVANYLKQKYGFQFLVFSDVLREEAMRRGLLRPGLEMEQVKKVLADFGDAWRKETGKNEIIAEKLIEKIKSLNLQKVTVDGFRAPAEVELFGANFPKFKLIYVFAPADVRFKRRRLEDHTVTREAFDNRDKQDIEKKGLGKVIEMTNMELNNSTDYRSLFLQIDHVMKSVF